MRAEEIRRSYLDYFVERGHTLVPSSPLVPTDDPTLLFTNAGMNQFKDVLLGREKRDYVRATSVQKCVRAGGKHNDLDAVGNDGRHLTFFEMLGNWSFGDYYKREAINWGWEFVTKTLGFPSERLWVSIYKDDDESRRIWRADVGLADERIVPLGDVEKGDEENFWSMGPTGPCGPCSEVHYDMGTDVGCGRPACTVGCDCDRFSELWNLVFMEFDRDTNGKLTPLPFRSVDTGMGLDRVVAVAQGASTVFGTDLFAPYLKWLHDTAGCSYDDPEVRSSMCVIADHIRSLTFALAERAAFGNIGRGYVLRRILRRAVRHGRILGFKEPFLHEMVPIVNRVMGGAYPELSDSVDHVSRAIRLEEERFFITLDRGLERLATAVGEAKAAGQDRLSGEIVFLLHDTFGFPADLTGIIAGENGLGIDLEGYRCEMEKQKTRSRAARRFYDDAARTGEWVNLHMERAGEKTEFVGYDALESEAVVRRYRVSDDQIEMILDRTPFYAESGGQVGDQGHLLIGDHKLSVDDTQRLGDSIVQICMSQSEIDPSALEGPVWAIVDAERRFRIHRNHTATHLLQAALQRVLGEDVRQSGSLVAAQRLRFDFTYDEGVTSAQLAEVERIVNAWVMENHRVIVHSDVPVEEAKKRGAMALFGEKYGDVVRMVEVEGVSLELCGGTHCTQTAEIGLIRIVSESAVAAGIRRIEAVTGMEAYTQMATRDGALREASQFLNTSAPDLPERVQKLQADLKQQSREIRNLKKQIARGGLGDLSVKAEEMHGTSVLVSRVPVEDMESLRQVMDSLRKTHGDGVILLGADVGGKVALLCNVGKQLSKRLSAGDLLGEVAAICAGGGGGSATRAQAGGKDVGRLDDALEKGRALIREALKEQ